MKITLDRKLLSTSLSNLFKTVSDSTVLPILESVLIEVKDGKISYTVSDLENTCTYSHLVSSGGECRFCIPAGQFLYFIKNATEDVITLEIIEGKNIILTDGAFKAKLKHYPKDFEEFPVTPAIEDAKEFKLHYNDFGDKFKSALKFVSGDWLRPSMTGIYINTDKDNNLCLAATDAHSLYWDIITRVDRAIDGFIMPSKSARLIAENFKGQVVGVKVSERIVEFKTEYCQIVFRTIDARYPDYKTVIPNLGFNFFLKRKQLISLLQMSYGFVNKSTSQNVFKVSRESITVEGGDNDFEMEFSYNVPVYNPSAEFSSFEFTFDAKKYMKILKSNKDEYVKISHSQSPTKAFITDDKYLLIPLMVNN